MTGHANNRAPHRDMALDRARRVAPLVAAVLVFIAGCTTPIPPTAPPVTGSADPSGSAAPTVSPVPTPVGSPTTLATPTPTAGVAAGYAPTQSGVPGLDCSGPTGGVGIDATPNDASADPVAIATATRSLRAVHWTDSIAVEGSRSAVIREGRAVLRAAWVAGPRSAWQLGTVDGCVEVLAELTPPRGLVPDAIAEVTADGVAVRTAPSDQAPPVVADLVLKRGDSVFIVAGATRVAGIDWYPVLAGPEGDLLGPLGWVRATTPAGAATIDDIAQTACPRLPDDTLRLGVIPDVVLLHCFGGSDVSFQIEANVYCQGASFEGPIVAPAWLTPRCGLLSGDACGWCGIFLAVDPQFGALPAEEAARWSVTGHFDDPVASTCTLVAPPPSYLPSAAELVLGCRTTLALTFLQRIGDASG